MAISPLDLQTAPADLGQVHQRIAAALASPLPAMRPLIRQLEHYHGKMLRPRLVLLMAQALGHVREEHLTLAAVVEMVHLATLVHDDVLDEADQRRGQATIHRMFGAPTAILLGDYLFSHAFRLCSSLGDQHASELISGTAARLCEGEVAQINARGRLDLTVDEYEFIIASKTAALISTSCALGASYTDADGHLVHEAAGFGHELGMAFQIVDDLLDLVGERRTLGKPVGRDLAMGKLTLPLILHLQRVDAAGRELTHRQIEQGAAALPAIRQALHSSGAMDAALDEARKRVGQALAHLAMFPPSPARDTLRTTAEFVLLRQK